MRDLKAVATEPTGEDEGRLDMVLHTVIPRPSDEGSAELHTGLDAGPILNGHGAAAPSSAIATRLAEPAGQRQVHEGAALAFTLRLNLMARQTAQLAQRVKELETELEQRGRRLQQLIGERDELRSILGRRDAELSRSNREIGAIEARAEQAAGRSPALFAAARSLLDRLLRARPASRATKPASPRPPQRDGRTDQRRLVPWIKDCPPKDILAVLAFGLSETEIVRVLHVVENYCRKHEIAPLLLTDNDGFELFRNRRVLFEFLPARSEQERLASELDWRLYMLRRLALIRRKWRPSRVVAFGRRATEVMQLWLDSPFEETPIPATPRCDAAGDGTAWEAAQASA